MRRAHPKTRAPPRRGFLTIWFYYLEAAAAQRAAGDVVLHQNGVFVDRFSVDALEELSKTRPPLDEPDVFALALQKLYEHDVLSDEGILAWGASSTSPLRNSPQVGALLAFLEDDDEDESSEEGSD